MYSIPAEVRLRLKVPLEASCCLPLLELHLDHQNEQLLCFNSRHLEDKNSKEDRGKTAQLDTVNLTLST